MLPDLYHSHHSQHMEDIPFWISLASHSGDPILELGCGTGRVLFPMARAGHCCIGMDRDLGMLQFLLQNFGRAIEPKPMLVAADITRFCLAVEFPLVILPCNTISTLDEDELHACLACVCRHLSPGGIFATSLHNPVLLDQLPAKSLPEFEEVFLHPQSGDPVQVSSGWHRTKRLFVVTWIYDLLHPNGAIERLNMQAVHHLRPVQAYLEAFQAAGLIITDTFGDFDRSAYTYSSPNLIIQAIA